MRHAMHTRCRLAAQARDPTPLNCNASLTPRTPSSCPSSFLTASRRHLALPRAQPDDATPSTSGAPEPTPPPLPQTPTPAPVPAAAAPAPSSGSSNGFLAGGAFAAGAVIFAASRLLAGGPSLAALEGDAVPLDDALRNGRPTVVEFYASWWVWCWGGALFGGGGGWRWQPFHGQEQ